MDELVEIFKANLLFAALRVNDNADRKDVNRNRVSYGVTTAYADVIRTLGTAVDIDCWERDGYLRISTVTINGDTTYFPN